LQAAGPGSSRPAHPLGLASRTGSSLMPPPDTLRNPQGTLTAPHAGLSSDQVRKEVSISSATGLKSTRRSKALRLGFPATGAGCLCLATNRAGGSEADRGTLPGSGPKPEPIHCKKEQ
jgi:hypothetical protein